MQRIVSCNIHISSRHESRHYTHTSFECELSLHMHIDRESCRQSSFPLHSHANPRYESLSRVHAGRRHETPVHMSTDIESKSQTYIHADPRHETPPCTSAQFPRTKILSHTHKDSERPSSYAFIVTEKEILLHASFSVYEIATPSRVHCCHRHTWVDKRGYRAPSQFEQQYWSTSLQTTSFRSHLTLYHRETRFERTEEQIQGMHPRARWVSRAVCCRLNSHSTVTHSLWGLELQAGNAYSKKARSGP